MLQKEQRIGKERKRNSTSIGRKRRAAEVNELSCLPGSFHPHIHISHRARCVVIVCGNDKESQFGASLWGERKNPEPQNILEQL